MARWERLTALVAIGAAGLIACDTTATSNAVVSDSAGIVIVRNTRPARDTMRLTTPAVRIGDDETKTEAVFQEVHDVAFTSAGHIVVVRSEERRVGEHVRQLS